jgi:hypothetical protein
MRSAVSEFRDLDLRVHSFLGDVSLHDVSAIDLPGGGHGRTIGDIRALLPWEEVMKANLLVAALFKLRVFFGRLLGWDKNPDRFEQGSYLHLLDADTQAKSLLPPGTADGPFRLLYMFPKESVSEIQNATVHAFLCAALQKLDSGYRFYWAVYVKPVSWFTPVYMHIIDPFRRLVVYPAMLGRIRTAWIRKYDSA